MDAKTTLTDRALEEVSALALELFATTYGMDWEGAITEAVNTLVELATYAEAWDEQVSELDVDAGDDGDPDADYQAARYGGGLRATQVPA